MSHLRNCDITRPTLSYIRLKNETPLSDQELYDRIRKTVSNKHELQVLESFLILNKLRDSCRSRAFPLISLVRHVLKTNFYTPTKVAVSFRLSPDFLPESEYPKRPVGMFLVIGRSFGVMVGLASDASTCLKAPSSEVSIFASAMSLEGVYVLFDPGVASRLLILLEF